MASTSEKIEAISSAFDLILPPSFLHDTRQVADRLEELIQAEQLIASTMKGPRRKEFTTARVMAHQLMKVASPLSSQTTEAILRDDDGCALWPGDFTGSISHTKNICSACIGKQRPDPHSVGIDIETLGRLSLESKRRISSPEEQKRIEVFADKSDLDTKHAYTLIFSAKEAFFKYQFPSTRIWLEFQDVEVTDIDGEALEVRASKLDSVSLPSIRKIYYKFTSAHVATAVWG